MKYSVKLLLRINRANSHGHYPIYLRIIIAQKSSELSTGYFIPERQWEEKSQVVKSGHPQAEIINADITGKKSAIMQCIVEANMKGEPITAAQVKDQFAGKGNLHNIFDFIDDFKKNVQHKREAGTIENYAKYSRKLELFVGSRNLSFEQIDIGFLQRYEDSLRAEELSGNYIFANFKMLRTFFNAARRREIITCYPFKNYENPVYVQNDKAHLTIQELDKWEEYADGATDPALKQSAIYFLLGCYTGFRISDWIQFDLKKNVHGGKIRLRATKNGEWITMPITPRLQRTLNRIKKTPLEIEEPTINEKLKAIAKALEIKKHLTSHSGRHTFAVTLCAEQGIGVEVCASLMGITISTCAENYYRITKTKIDKECLLAWGEL